MYAPPPFGLDADTVDEYIELRNFSNHPVSLFDPLQPTNTWHLAGGIAFTFPANVTLDPWSFLLVVAFDPNHDPTSLDWFRRRYNVDPNTPVFGPFQGNLGNQGDRIGLYLPDRPEIPPSPIAGFVPYVFAEEIHYLPSALAAQHGGHGQLTSTDRRARIWR